MSLDVDMDNPIFACWRVEAVAQAGLDAMRQEVADMIFGRGNPRNLSALAPPVKAGLIADAAKMLMAAFPDWATVFKYSNVSSG